MTERQSPFSKFHKKDVRERQDILSKWSGLNHEDLDNMGSNPGLTLEQANHMVENVVGLYAIPMGIGTNFIVNDQEYAIPMVTEESSVIAAASSAAKTFRETGGFTASADESIMIGQIQLLDIPNLEFAAASIQNNKENIIYEANINGGSIVDSGGGAKDIEIREFKDTEVGNMLVLHLLYDAKEAMGANVINSVLEHIAPKLEEITGARANLRILSNLSDQRKAYAHAQIPVEFLAKNNLSGKKVTESIVEASVLAEVDSYRAATSNKGVMNGIDAVVIATGNDWRAVEAGAHAYAARDGKYLSLTKWRITEDILHGKIELPLAVGTVGGSTKVHPAARTAMKILDNPSSQELAGIIAAVGLAQNFAAIRALVTEGIQHGHMRLHANQVAITAGATGEQIKYVAEKLIEEKNIRHARAVEILEEL